MPFSYKNSSSKKKMKRKKPVIFQVTEDILPVETGPVFVRPVRGD